MTHASAQLPVTAERIERGLLQLARIIADVNQAEALQLAPIYDRLERELEAMTTNDVRSRALRRLAAADQHRETTA